MTFWLGASIISVLMQLTYWFVLARGFRRASASRVHSPSPGPVSIIVAARDEAHRLPALLSALSKQTGSFEVVIADDGSTDSTPSVLRNAEQFFPDGDLRIVRIETPVQPRKKHALAAAISAARYDRLLFTDADCKPDPDWLSSMASLLTDDAVVIGYSPFERRPGALNRIARYETFVTGFLTAAAVGLDRPYMAVGRNLAYSRMVYDRIDGFAHSEHLLSGDDDLLIQEVVRSRAATVVHAFAPESFVESEAPRSWRAWLRQKTRHTSAGRYYDSSIQTHLLLFHASAIALWLLPFVGGSVCLIPLAVRQVVQYVVLRRGAGVLREPDLMPAQPFLEAAYILYNLLLAPIGVVMRRREW